MADLSEDEREWGMLVILTAVFPEAVHSRTGITGRSSGTEQTVFADDTLAIRTTPDAVGSPGVRSWLTVKEL